MMARIKNIQDIKWNTSKGSLSGETIAARIEVFRGKLVDVEFSHVRSYNGLNWIKIKRKSCKSVHESLQVDDYEWIEWGWIDLHLVEFFNAL